MGQRLKERHLRERHLRERHWMARRLMERRSKGHHNLEHWVLVSYRRQRKQGCLELGPGLEQMAELEKMVERVLMAGQVLMERPEQMAGRELMVEQALMEPQGQMVELVLKERRALMVAGAHRMMEQRLGCSQRRREWPRSGCR